MVQSQALTLGRSLRIRETEKVLWSILAVNWAVAGGKVFVGLTTHCMMITADGLHSFSDGLSNVVGLIGVRLSSHPADADHPYGHQKFETLAAFIIAFFLFVVSYGIFREAAAGLLHPRVPEVTGTSFIVMGVTLVVNVLVVGYERRQARLLSSEILSSDAWHTLSDIFVSLSVIVALFGLRWKIPYLDASFSIFIAAVIAVTALGILKRSADVLTDKAVLDPGCISRIARGFAAVHDCHEIRTRGREGDVYVDLHVLVDGEMTVKESHHLANLIENGIRKDIPAVRDVVVHIEPDTHEHDEIEKFPD